ncbi:hypothetical protein [Methylobacterium segetis]|uniref:hypothetical protein n=1 Tax=Methylobacterium segetis TaxID=2488750 RepID=UPI00104F449D|nr:hypothetical protein [Methylobacterium segetis]
MSTNSVTAPAQGELPLEIAKEVEIDGVGMGVLSDGTPYLTLRGLARMCGVEHTNILRIANGWNDDPPMPRVARIKATLAEQGFTGTTPYIPVKRDGVIHHAFSDLICMAFLEYYAFEAKPPSQHAVDNYRLLARKTFRSFIYARVGYDPDAAKQAIWSQFHDRIDLNWENVPDGYFSIFKESAGIQLALIREGVVLGSHFVPDGSIGCVWGKHWRDAKLADSFGERRPYLHYFPDTYPQSASNPQQAHCYPDAALGYFKKWLREKYLREGLPKYLNTKVKDKSLPAVLATAAVKAIQAGPTATVRALTRR